VRFPMLRGIIANFSVLALAALGAAACASRSDGTSSEAQNQTAALGEEGASCGARRGFPDLGGCKPGFECRFSTPSGMSSDAPGKCVKSHRASGEEGGFCGGFASIECKSGLECEYA